MILYILFGVFVATFIFLLFALPIVEVKTCCNSTPWEKEVKEKEYGEWEYENGPNVDCRLVKYKDYYQEKFCSKCGKYHSRTIETVRL